MGVGVLVDTDTVGSMMADDDFVAVVVPAMLVVLPTSIAFDVGRHRH